MNDDECMPLKMYDHTLLAYFVQVYVHIHAHADYTIYLAS